MDLLRSVDKATAGRLPRTRGDGPIDPDLARFKMAAPPHPRGWTLSRCDSLEHGQGSPAPAGMDPMAW